MGDRGKTPSPLPLWVSFFEISKSLCTAYRVELCELFFMDVDKVLEMIQNSVDTAYIANEYTQYTGQNQTQTQTQKIQPEEELNIWDFI